jgi:hypothetical protein
LRSTRGLTPRMAMSLRSTTDRNDIRAPAPRTSAALAHHMLKRDLEEEPSRTGGRDPATKRTRRRAQALARSACPSRVRAQRPMYSEAPDYWRHSNSPDTCTHDASRRYATERSSTEPPSGRPCAPRAPSRLFAVRSIRRGVRALGTDATRACLPRPRRTTARTTTRIVEIARTCAYETEYGR